MKHLFSISFVLISCIGFSQEELKQNPLFLSTGNNGNFESVYNRLSAISENINETTFTINHLDEIRQGQIIISTNDIGRSIGNMKIDTRPSLNIEAQRVMFTGNFANPRMPISQIINDIKKN